jgi:hypothetical protein
MDATTEQLIRTLCENQLQLAVLVKALIAYNPRSVGRSGDTRKQLESIIETNTMILDNLAPPVTAVR